MTLSLSAGVSRVGSQNANSSFLVQTFVGMHGFELPLNALCDTGADTGLLISPTAARAAISRLGAIAQPLRNPIPLKDYQMNQAGSITHSVRLSFRIDNRLFPSQEFYVTDIGHDVFIGQHWLSEKDVWIHCRTRTIRWPASHPPEPRGSPRSILPSRNPNLQNPWFQKDADRRDQMMEDDIKRIQILQRPQSSSQPTTIVASIQAQVQQDPRRQKWSRLPMPTTPIPFEPSCYGVKSVQTPPAWRTYDGEPIPFPHSEDPSHVQAVRQKLPARLAHLEGFFSKAASTKLPPYREGHDVVLELKADRVGSPPTYRTPVSMMPLEKETTDELLEIGFIERCMEPNPAPVLFADKPHSTDKRFCIDYRWINRFLKDRLVPAPDVSGTIAQCRNAKHFSKIDIIRAFNRLRMSVGSEYLTAFKTRQGTFQWKVLPFGLKVGPAWWQDFINAQLNELLDTFASAYADDVLIYSDGSVEEHWSQVEEVIYRLQKAGLQGDIKKSKFNVTEVDYLGIIMEAGKGIRIDPRKISAIMDWEFDDLTSIAAIRSFLGLVGYVRTFCHHASEAAEPLTRLLKKGAAWEHGPEQKQAFTTLQKLACDEPVLAFFRPGAETVMEADASRAALGGVIWQKQLDTSWKPIGFFSKTMTPPERAYPIQDRELLAVVRTLQHFEPELLGTQFVVLTDHQALIYWSTKRFLSTRQVAWTEYLSNFDIQFKYRPGKSNVAADALSRKTIDLPTVRAREREERTMAMIPPDRVTHEAGPSIAAIPESPPPAGADLVDLIRYENRRQDLGYENGKLVVPELSVSPSPIFLRTALIREAHEPKIFGHQGQTKTLEAVKRYYTWPSISRDIRRFVKNCHDCQRNKTRHDKTPGLLHPLPIPNLVWEHVAVDGKDMPPDQHGYDYVWAFICKFSRIMATIPGKKTDNAEKVAQRYYRYVYRFLGMPYVWISDNAGPFISEFLQTINNLTGTKHRHGSSLHPQTQGAVEITNADLDQRLRFYVDKYQTNWSEHLPALDLAHNSSWHSAIGMAPLKVALGSDPRNPLSTDLPTTDVSTDQKRRATEIVQQTQQVQELARKQAEQAQAAQVRQANKKRRPVNFLIGDHVFVKKKGFQTAAPTTRLDSQWAGPWRIRDMRGHSYVLDLPDSVKCNNLFHADRLRKASMDPLPQQSYTPPEPEEINGEPEYEVDRILASRLFGTKKALQYQIAWKGYDPDETWYNASNFKNSPIKLNEFHTQYPTAAGPPRRLQDWIVAAAEDKWAGEHPDDDQAEHGTLGKRRTTPRRHR
jgi:RNase H-like domain found in reverse transcriptase/Reverse transcriptase (RNA-dependent DNA polymerase)/Integrase zinc binding domain/Chromo (CHRromatin Organisation MOdifier) domain